MIDKLMNLYHQYYNQFMTWYKAADDATQVAVIVILGIIVLIILAGFYLSKITR